MYKGLPTGPTGQGGGVEASYLGKSLDKQTWESSPPNS